MRYKPRSCMAGIVMTALPRKPPVGGAFQESGVGGFLECRAIARVESALASLSVSAHRTRNMRLLHKEQSNAAREQYAAQHQETVTVREQKCFAPD